MPIYQYYEIFPDGSESDPFEVIHKMSDPPIKFHPQSGNPVKKCLGKPNLNTIYSDLENKQKLDPSNLHKKGFTQYEKDKTTGRYYKTAGKDANAPEEIDPN